MASRLGPLVIECDAPPYSVVRACREIGFEAPEDVRWRRMSRFQQRMQGLTSLFGPGSWAGLLGGKDAPVPNCSCGCPVPALEACSFLFRSGKSQSYWLGQCRGCHTIFWEEA